MRTYTESSLPTAPRGEFEVTEGIPDVGSETFEPAGSSHNETPGTADSPVMEHCARDTIIPLIRRKPVPNRKPENTAAGSVKRSETSASVGPESSSENWSGLASTINSIPKHHDK